MDLLVNIDVDDLAKAISFDEQAAGWRVVRWSAAFGVAMLGASSEISRLACAPRMIARLSRVAFPNRGHP